MPDNASQQHPPIPPGCEYFKISTTGRPMFMVRSRNGRRHWVEIAKLLRIDAGYWRPIIAAVAEVAWRREADRIVDVTEHGVYEGGGMHYQHAKMEACLKVNAAIDNAAQWRAWGERTEADNAR